VSTFESELLARLGALQEQNLFRRLRVASSPQQPRINIDGCELLNFSSNDYLGLATHPKLKAAASEATEKFGTGSGASRLISGSLLPHHELEEALAHLKNTEAALSFSSGYATALGVIPALLGKEDIIILDKLVHASIVDAARLSGATLRIFHHNQLDDLESILRWADARPVPKGEVLIVTETLFSMDGDIAPLREIVALKERYGAWLMIDEAHATGLFGANLRGLAEEAGVSERVEVQMGTLGKALGSAGGYIAGSRTLITYLINKARSFIFSTAPSPGVSAAARAALAIVDSPEGWSRVKKLRANIAAFAGGESGENPQLSPIVPVLLGDETKAMAVADALRDRGFFVPAIRYPSVPRGKARLRFTICSAHSIQDIQDARAALGSASSDQHDG
jgi:8-amino-7-oxononanoate synthase